MNKIKELSVILLVAVSVCLSSYAISGASDGAVWRVQSGQNEIFIGGTIHLLSRDDYPLPKTFDLAYQQADSLVFEVDIEKTKTPEFGQMMLEKSLYRHGLSLRKVLSPEVYTQLEAFLASRGGNMANVENMKPGMLSIFMIIDELTRLELAGQGVDDFYNSKAVNDKKPLYYLETIEQQVEFLVGMGEGNEDALILQTIKDVNELSISMAELKAAWREGDAEELMSVTLTPWKDQFPAIYQSMIVKRNNVWLPKIESMLLTPEVEYVLVGALHLVGSDGLLDMLEAQGYQVEKLKH